MVISHETFLKTSLAQTSCINIHIKVCVYYVNTNPKKLNRCQVFFKTSVKNLLPGVSQTKCQVMWECTSYFLVGGLKHTKANGIMTLKKLVVTNGAQRCPINSKMSWRPCVFFHVFSKDCQRVFVIFFFNRSLLKRIRWTPIGLPLCGGPASVWQSYTTSL